MLRMIFYILVFLLLQVTAVISEEKDEKKEPPQCGDSWIDSEGQEVIVICGEEPCEPSELRVSGMCMSRGFMELVCDRFLIGCGFLPPPDPPDPGGTGSSTPTIAQCNHLFNRCAARSVRDTQLCQADQIRIAGDRVRSGTTCFGNDADVIDTLPLCELDDLTKTISDPSSLEGSRLRSCKERFREKAMRDCVNGIKESTASLGLGLKLEFTSGFGKFGPSISSTHTVKTPPGTGIRTACAEFGNTTARLCSQAKNSCLAKATGAAPAPLEETIDDILAQIDRKRLGFPTVGDISHPGHLRPFRSLGQQAQEPDETFRRRLRFLADWSGFLVSEGLAPDAQSEVERTMQGAQRQLNGFVDDFLGRAMLLWTADPVTDKFGSDEARMLIETFEKTGGLEQRLASAEAQFFKPAEQIFGSPRMERFQQSVWPDIGHFGLIQPMRPVQTVSGDGQ